MRRMRLFPWAGALVAGLLLVSATALAYEHRGSTDFTPLGTQPGLLAGLEEPEACSSCHGGFTAPSVTFMPHSTWAGSMMANAARDPLFWAALDVANADAPGIGDWCLRCHSPGGWLNGRVRKNGFGGTVNGTNGCLLTGDHDDLDHKGNDYSGLTCHFCHRLMPNGPLGEPGYTDNGNFWLDDALECVTPDNNSYFGPCRRGPYTYAAPNFEMQPPHGWVYSKHHTESAICGTCHNVTSPTPNGGSPVRTLILNDGTNTGLAFPIERTFAEWTQSDFADVIYRDGFGDGATLPLLARGKTCQNCHMADSSNPLARACQQNPAGSRTNDLPVHELVGANTWIPNILKGIYGSIAQLDREDEYDRTIASARALLQTGTAAVDVTLSPYTPGGPTLNAQVKVTNLSGHKLPTGYGEGRRMWLNVQARDNNGALIFESANYNATSGVLTEDAQARVYEVQQGIWNAGNSQCEILDGSNRKEFHFVLNNCIRKDNRIPPLGFRGASDFEIRPIPVGSYPPVALGSNRLVNYDNASYAIPVPLATPLPITVTATLKFQVSSKEYIEFLRNQAVERSFPAENTLCAGGPNRPFDVGPQNKSRGQFIYDLWADVTYGKSPPEDVVGDVATSAP